jgi:hypothetical protein
MAPDHESRGYRPLPIAIGAAGLIAAALFFFHGAVVVPAVLAVASSVNLLTGLRPAMVAKPRAKGWTRQMVVQLYVFGAFGVAGLAAGIAGLANLIEISPVASLLAIVAAICFGYLSVGGFVVWRRSERLTDR